jgi:hypothetical protein
VVPLAALAPSWTPYRYCFDNPINLTDPSGLWESTDVTLNADGTYKVVGGRLDGDKNIYVVKDGKRTGEIIGQSLFEKSFYNEDFKGDNKWMGSIDTKSVEGASFLVNKIYTNTPSLLKYAANWEDYNFKSSGYDKSKGSPTNYAYRGSEFSSDIYASARDFGNIGAGYVAGRGELNWGGTKFIFERFQAKQNGNIFGSGFESEQTVQGERLGWEHGNKQWMSSLSR